MSSDPVLIHDIRFVCHTLRKGWQSEGWGNRLDVGDFTVFVSPQGLTGTSFIQVSVMPKNAPSGMAVPFFRELDRQGMVRNERGQVSFSQYHPQDWLRASILEALAWAEAQPVQITEPVSTGPVDFLFDD